MQLYIVLGQCAQEPKWKVYFALEHANLALFKFTAADQVLQMICCEQRL